MALPAALSLSHSAPRQCPRWRTTCTRSASFAPTIAPTCARCWPRSRVAAWCASRATPPSRSRPASPAPRSTATTSWCIRPRAWPRPCAASAARARASSPPIGWDEALDEIVARWKTIIAESGPLALLGYAYSAHQGQINRGLVNGLFHALGTSRLQGGHGVRHLLRDGLGPHRRPGRRRRPRVRRAVRPDHLLGRRPDGGQRALLGQGRGGAQGRRAGDRDRSAPQPHSPAGRLAHPDPHRHRCRPRARHHAYPCARRPVRRELPRDPHARLRSGQGRDPAALRAGAGGRDHRARHRRRRALRGHVRARQGVLHPPRRGYDAARRRRPGHACGGAPAGGDRRLRARRAAARCCSRPRHAS